MAGDRGPEHDPFEGLQLDESFIRAAPRQELSAAERQERAGRLDADRRLLPDVPAGRRSPRRHPGTSRSRWPWALVGLLLIVGVLVVRQRNTAERPPRGTSTASDVFAIDGEVTAYPPAPADASAQPLGSPPAAPASPGPFTFSQVQPGTKAPVTYDPCRPIALVVNSRAAPAGAEGVVREAAAAVSRATGLRLVVEGPTDEVPIKARRPVLIERYGNRWAPALIAWSDPAETTDLVGDVAGLGGSQSVAVPGSDQLSYVTGVVLLDGPQLAQVLAEPDGRAEAIAVVTHELGHLVGLGHVSDPTQLMAPSSHVGVTTFRSGDLAGLAALGAGPCHPDL